MRYIAFFILFLFVGCGGGDSDNTDSGGDIVQTKKSWYTPDAKTTWQWQLRGDINQKYDVNLYDIDLFDTNISVINSLKDSGKKVICYFSAGSFEDWREDKESFPVNVLGQNLDAWEGEKWLDIRSDKLHSIMEARFDLAQQKGCDGVEPDNVDGYSNDTGFELTSADQIRYNKFLATEAHKRDLSIGLKNDLDQITTLEPFFDFAVNEQCHEYDECNSLKPFIDANKPVLNTEYNRNKEEAYCQDAILRGFQTLILPLDLDDSFRISCEDKYNEK